VNDKTKRYLTLLILALGATAIYILPYLRWTYYDPMREALQLTHTQFGTLMSAYGIASMLLYFPGGWMADRVSARKLLTFAFASTGILGLFFATYPPYNMCLLIYLLWGAIATLTFWAALIKATRDLAGSSEQGSFFGLLEGSRGLLQTILSFVILALFNRLGGGVFGLTWAVYIISALNIVAAVLTWFTLEDSKTIRPEASVLSDIINVIKMPVVWLIAVVVLCNYSIYIGTTYLTPYITEIFGATVAISAFIAIVRNYVLQFIGGPVGGFIADKTGSTSKIVTYCYVIALVTMVLFFVIPGKSSMLSLLVVNMIVLAAAIFAMRGIYFATMEEIKIPAALTGSVVGFASMIGFTPDIFMNPLAGHFLDTYQGITGYKYLFAVMLVFVILGLAASVVLLKMTKKKKQETDISLDAN
jgi:predicted MFS family arabinose efflux permease